MHGRARAFREGRDEEYSYPTMSPEEVAARRRHVAGAFEFFEARLPGAKLSRDYYQPHVVRITLRDPWGEEIVLSHYEETLADWRGLDDPLKYILDAVAEKIARRGVARLLGCRPGEVMAALQRRYPTYAEAVRQWQSALAASRQQAERLLGITRSNP